MKGWKENRLTQRGKGVHTKQRKGRGGKEHRQQPAMNKAIEGTQRKIY